MLTGASGDTITATVCRLRIAGHSVKDIAARLGMSRAAVSQRINKGRRAHAKIRAALPHRYGGRRRLTPAQREAEMASVVRRWLESH